MKNLLLNKFKQFLDWQQRQYHKIEKNKEDIGLPFKPLSPINNAKNVSHYEEALNWALNKRDEIKNIAISGPYGSGKSSILKTFKENYKFKYNFLNISLATFNGKSKNEDDLLRLLELSILQQLFFHEKDNKIPDSRFRKIKSLKNIKLFLWAFLCFLFITSLLYIISPNLLGKFHLIEVNTNSSFGKIVHILSVITIVSCSLYFIFRSIRTVKNISIKKIGVSQASIEIDDKVSKSIFNIHLDEIIYFFEVTGYNVVILEDLDRFNETDIFTKLREINYLINHSKKVKQEVVFIYAIKDDLFKEKERTKFFDFIIPIIPIINFSNSNSKLLELIKHHNFNIEEELIDNISLFIDDMRLLYNIMNEYYIYSKKLNKKLNQNKLLAIIAYKNIYSKDFINVSQNKGVLYSLIFQKVTYIEDKIKRITFNINKLKEEIKKSNEEFITNKQELRLVYISKIIEQINNNNKRTGRFFYKFYINNQAISVSKVIEDEWFNELMNLRHLSYTYNVNNSHTTSDFNFFDIENNKNHKLTYREREKLIDKEKINKLKLEIEELENEKNEVKKHKIKELISFEDVSTIIKNQTTEIEKKENNENQEKLIFVLLKNGYIDENYLDYISIFHEGSLSDNDQQFLIAIRTETESEFDFKLNRIENLIKKIKEEEFEKKFVLNYSLFEYLLNSSSYKQKKMVYYKQLATGTKTTISFVDGFMEQTKNIEKFIEELCTYWATIWEDIIKYSNYPKEKLDKYLELIIKYAALDDIEIIFKTFKSYLETNEQLLGVKTDIEKVRSIIELLDLKLEVLKSDSTELLDYIYQNNNYAIIPETIEFYLKRNNIVGENDIQITRYSIIKSSKLSKLKSYIESNINEYITAVYLKMEEGVFETIKAYLELLNNDKIEMSNKMKLIGHTETLVDDISKVKKVIVIRELLRASKMKIIWHNFVDVFNRFGNELLEEITICLNIEKNVLKLKKVKINEIVSKDIDIKKFVEFLILNDEISDENYDKLLASVPYSYTDIDVNGLSKNKIESLIKRKILSVTPENFELLKNKFPKQANLLLENNTERLINSFKDYEINDSNLLFLLKSKRVPIFNKEWFVSHYTKERRINNNEILNEVALFYLDNEEFKTDRDIRSNIINNKEIESKIRIKLFNKNYTSFSKKSINQFLCNLSEPYESITKNGKRPLLENDNINLELVMRLSEIEYISSYTLEDKGIRINTFNKRPG